MTHFLPLKVEPQSQTAIERDNFLIREASR